MVQVKEIMQHNQIMLRGGLLSVVRHILTMDKRFIEYVHFFNTPRINSKEYEVTAICQMTRRWKARQIGSSKHLKLIQ